MSDVRLNEYDKEEWELVYRSFKPNASQEEYDAAWARFVEAKAEHERQRNLQ